VAYVPPRRLRIPLRLLVFASVPATLIAGGTVGYRFTEGWSWFDSFYVAVITLTSIGYGDKHAFTIAGRVFTLVLALGGISTFALAAAELFGTIATGETHEYLWRRRMRKRIDALAHHVIVCGYGAVGAQVCAQLRRAGVPVIAIDRDEAAAAAARDCGAEFVVGDATADATLVQAGIARARALIALAGSDADNVLITMTARALSRPLLIVSRAEDEAAVPKLLQAGATRTMSPHAIAGGHIAQAVLRPAVFDFIEDITTEGEPDVRHLDLRMDEQLVRPGSVLDGKTVGSSGIRSWRGLILVAIRHPDGHLEFDPEADARIAAGDTLITLGHRKLQGRADALALHH
jgi:voltage-gated potassium channel